MNADPKTLLSINNYHYVRGGAEAVFLDHNEIFESLGWRVVPFSMQHEKNAPSDWDGHFVDEIELGQRYGAADTLVKAAKAIYSWEAKKKVGELARRTQPAIAHGHNIYHHLSPAILGPLKRLGIPVVLTLHDLKIACPAYRMFTHDGICERCKSGRLWQATIHRCMHGSTALSAWVTLEATLHRLLGSYEKNVDRFVVPSRFYRRKLVEWGWDEDRFAYIPNFVDAAAIRCQPKPGEAFVYFGRLSHEKGLATFIRAAARAGVRARIIGTGPESEALQRLAESEQADVEFPGFLSGEALFDALRSARAVVLPSEWYENAPISLLEAFAAGTPVIGADIGGIPELIDADRGSVFEAFSVDSLEAELRRFADCGDAELRQMGLNARAYVESNHSREIYAERCLALYRELVESDGG